MPSNNPNALVSSQWLDSHINDSNLKLIDASWYLPNMQRDAYAEYRQSHIAGALFFDIDKICDQTSQLPHMAPSVETFSACLSALGIGAEDQVVVYDGAGLFSAARVWWLFKLMGLDRVAVLDGGLPKWNSEGRKTDNVITQVEMSGTFNCVQRPILKNAIQVLAATQSKAYGIVDARAPGRFQGLEPEPREGLRSGHIPGSKNLFFKTLLQSDQTMKSPEELRSCFLAAGINMSQPLITTCGSGVTAAILNLGLTLIGQQDHFLYDGSWTEWGMDPTLPMETGQHH